MSHEHDLGLAHDLSTLFNRRRALGLFGGAGVAAVLAACADTSGSSGGSSSGSGSSTGSGTAAASGDEIPEETGGPYPGDGSNGPNALTESGIVRSDITRSFGSASGVAEGVPLTVKLRVLNVGDGATPYAGAAVYLWHCDRDGSYSMYSQEIADENYLRGVQAADDDGYVTFTSIYPAAYSSRRLVVGHRQRLQRRLLAAAGQGHRQRDLRHGGDAQRPGLTRPRAPAPAPGGSCRRRLEERRPPDRGSERPAADRRCRILVAVVEFHVHSPQAVSIEIDYPRPFRRFGPVSTTRAPPSRCSPARPVRRCPRRRLGSARRLHGRVAAPA